MKFFKVVIIGRSEILYNTALNLNKLGHKVVGVVTAKAAPEYKKSMEDFEDLAKSLNIPFLLTSKINEQKKFIKMIDADIGVSINYLSIIGKDVIDLLPYGILNVHGGDLPRYRGNACQAWAILNGEEKIGLCVHKMVGGELDSGDIISRDYVFIDSKTKIGEVLKWITLRTPGLVVEALENLGKNSEYYLERQSLNMNGATRCYPRKPEDGLIDWNDSAKQILRLVNASNRPYSGAYTFYKNKKLIIWDAEIENEEEKFFSIPGQIMLIGEDFVHVATGDGKLKINSCEWSNKLCNPAQIIKSSRDRFYKL